MISAVAHLKLHPRRPPDGKERCRDRSSLARWLDVDKSAVTNLLKGYDGAPRIPLVVKLSGFLRVRLPKELDDEGFRVAWNYWRIWSCNPRDANDFYEDMEESADRLVRQEQEKESKVIPGSKKDAQNT